jgi:hypothetical protein
MSCSSLQYWDSPQGNAYKPEITGGFSSLQYWDNPQAKYKLSQPDASCSLQFWDNPQVGK